MRVTTTDSDNVDEMNIKDVWDGISPNVHRPLSCRWTGEMRFKRSPDGAAPGHYFVGGCQTRRQASKRPDNVWPELWSAMSRKQKERAVEQWEAKRGAIERARETRSQPPAPWPGRTWKKTKPLMSTSLDVLALPRLCGGRPSAFR